jgi:predicted proteasome-type protease
MRVHLLEDDPYLEAIGRKWQDGITTLVRTMPEPEFGQRLPLGFVSAA